MSAPKEPKPKSLPIAPSLEPALETLSTPVERAVVDRRVLAIGGLAVGLGLVAAVIARVLTALIGLITNLAFYRPLRRPSSRPPETTWAGWSCSSRSAGGIIVGLMARYGSTAIRGHGIPEAMEQVLFNESRIPARMTFLKPLSAAIAIGTGGPFGAEGPIIATGGALGSLVGQLAARHRRRAQDAARRGRGGRHGGDVRQPRLRGAARDRAAALRVPPALARPRRARDRGRRGVRIAFVGSAPVFAMPMVARAERRSARVVRRHRRRSSGVASVLRHARRLRGRGRLREAPHPLDVVARARRPSSSACVGYFSPHTLGVGYDNIDSILAGRPRGARGRRLLRC